jgi:tripartite-type tricarboxylate transporter receptor subunit TctC
MRNFIFLFILLLSFFSSKLTAEVTAVYPNRPVRIVVPFVAGGGTDIVARAVAQKLSVRFSKQFVVDNRPGAGGAVGLDIMRVAVPDGYTLMLLSGSVIASRNLYKVKPTNLAPIALVSSQPYVLLVHAGLPVNSFAELLTLVRSKPNSIIYGSSGAGGMQHLTGTLLAQKAKAEMLHIPYKGGGQVIVDLISGQVQVAFLNPIGAETYIKEGRVRGLAVTSGKRSTSFPNLPSMSELVPGFDVSNWYAIVAPDGIPKSIVDLLNKSIAAIMLEPDIKNKLEKEGADLTVGTPAALGALMASENNRWSEVITKANLRP